ncbi:MAG TPA: GGDEF domain-containing protein [Burkholderiales bacterium]|nr:GGDEF domain-containing protein [Burkholderiales bacterium]
MAAVLNEVMGLIVPGAARAASMGIPADLPAVPAGYYQRIESIARRIRATRDLDQIALILDEALEHTRSLHDDSPLAVAEDRIRRADQEIQALKDELSKAIELTNVDPLTELLNRRGMKSAYVAEAARSDRHGTPLCVCFIDIDDFKRINDTHGHAAGDAALKHLARIMRATLRPNDVLARIGGEEFMVLLPDAGERAAFAALNRLLKSVSATAVISDRQHVGVTFTASVTARGLGETQDDVERRLDETLNRAKASGKNRVMFAPGG